MKIDSPRNDDRKMQETEKVQREGVEDEKARRFRKQLQRRQEVDAAPAAGIAAGPFELLATLRRQEREETPVACIVQTSQREAWSPEPVVSSLAGDPAAGYEGLQARLQEAVRLETVARAAVSAGVQAGMAAANSEYQVELGSTLFSRTRLRVRADDRNSLDVRCESDSATEREWFERHSDDLSIRMADLTGRVVRLDIVGAGS